MSRTLTITEYRQARAGINEVERLLEGAGGFYVLKKRVWLFFYRHWLNHVKIADELGP